MTKKSHKCIIHKQLRRSGMPISPPRHRVFGALRGIGGGWLAGILLGLAALSAGCQPAPPYAAQRLVAAEDDDDRPAQSVLGAQEQRLALDAMRSVAQPGQTDSPAKPAGPRGRWTDVPAAAYAAAAASEMAVFRTIELRDSYEFVLRTIDDRPARLVVHRRDEPHVYDADAAVGRFENDENARRELLRQFDDFMSRYGRKRQFEDS